MKCCNVSEWRYRQYLYCIFSAITISAGTIHETWTSPYLPQLKSENSPIGVTLTTTQSSLVTSMFFVGCFIGTTFTLYGVDYFGRKKNLLIGGALDLLSWLLIYFANSAIMIYFARMLGGMVEIIALNCVAMYIGEISDNDNRGKMSFLLVVFKNVGSVFGLIVGPYVAYKNFAICAGSISILGLICVSFIPESPFHLIRNYKIQEAKKVIQELSATSAVPNFVDKKFEQINANVENDMKNKSTIRELLRNPIYRKSLTIHLCLKLLLYFSGNSTIKMYMQTIIKLSGTTTISSSLSSVIFGLFNLFAALISGEVVDRLGRKPLLISSSVVCALTNFTLGLYFYLLYETNVNVDKISWLPLASLIIFEIFISIGILTLPYAVAAELYPINIKGIAISLIGMIVTPLGAIIQYMFEPLINLVGLYFIFWIFATCCFLGFIFGVFVFKETKGKSFEEIQRMLNFKK